MKTGSITLRRSLAMATETADNSFLQGIPVTGMPCSIVEKRRNLIGPISLHSEHICAILYIRKKEKWGWVSMDKLKLLIADGSEDFRMALVERLRGVYRVCHCADGNQAKELMGSFQPDIMVLDMMLPGFDGISLLQWAVGAGYSPAVLATTKFVSDYVLESADRFGVAYLMVKPCDVRATVARIGDISVRIHPPRNASSDPRAHISNLLLALGVPVKLRGYTYLREAILLMAQDPGQSITKILYPAVADLCGCADINVERSIRSAIAAAWENRDETLWKLYFPADSMGYISRPTNGAFISRLADCIREE